jgi:putative toxin-antitoxin system antitoxin component (TIGR02293 family)
VTVTYIPPRPVVSKEQRRRAYEALVTMILAGSEKEEAVSRVWTINAKKATGVSVRIWDTVLLPSATAYEILKRGVPSRALTPLGEYLGIGKGDLADLVDLDRTTAFRKVSTDQPLPLHAAESVLRLLELNRLAEDTFETPEAAGAWLRRAHPMLDGESPLDLAKSAYGAERVKEILIALKYGGAA